jgi:hypothetical protein
MNTNDELSAARSKNQTNVMIVLLMTIGLAMTVGCYYLVVRDNNARAIEVEAIRLKKRKIWERPMPAVKTD